MAQHPVELALLVSRDNLGSGSEMLLGLPGSLLMAMRLKIGCTNFSAPRGLLRTLTGLPYLWSIFVFRVLLVFAAAGTAGATRASRATLRAAGAAGAARAARAARVAGAAGTRASGLARLSMILVLFLCVFWLRRLRGGSLRAGILRTAFPYLGQPAGVAIAEADELRGALQTDAAAEGLAIPAAPGNILHADLVFVAQPV